MQSCALLKAAPCQLLQSGLINQPALLGVHQLEEHVNNQTLAGMLSIRRIDLPMSLTFVSTTFLSAEADARSHGFLFIRWASISSLVGLQKIESLL